MGARRQDRRHQGAVKFHRRRGDRIVLSWRLGIIPRRMDRLGEGGMMLNGVEVLAVSLGFLVFIWISVLVGSRAFGSPPEH